MLQYLSPDPPSLSPTILSPSTPDSALTPGGWVQPTMPYSPSTPATLSQQTAKYNQPQGQIASNHSRVRFELQKDEPQHQIYNM